MSKQQEEAYIRALLRERAGYEKYGKHDRVREVNDELRRVGHNAAPPRERAERMTRPERGPVDAQPQQPQQPKPKRGRPPKQRDQ